MMGLVLYQFYRMIPTIMQAMKLRVSVPKNSYS
jgi:hypothetical protein